MPLMRALLVLAVLSPLGCGGDDPSDAGADATAAACATDEECDDGRPCNGPETCAPSTPGADARGCARGEPPCTEEERCEEATGLCLAPCPEGDDLDGDGHYALACGGDDCDDMDARRFRNAPEVCDVTGIDEDCDPTTFGTRDADGDGYVDARCCNGEACGDDCDDMRPGAHPGEPEACNGYDDDCDGLVDEGVLHDLYPDGDLDGFGAAGSTPVEGCRASRGLSLVDTDCDDADPQRSPDLPEVCDAENRDENCDEESNPVSRCACSGSADRPCPEMGVCAGGIERCVAGTWSLCSISARPETCDGEDDDCDGRTDEGLLLTCFPDTDDDTYAPGDAGPIASCPAEGRATVGGCPRGRTDSRPCTLSSGLRRHVDRDPPRGARASQERGRRRLRRDRRRSGDAVTRSAPAAHAFARHSLGDTPTWRLNARLKLASDA